VLRNSAFDPEDDSTLVMLFLRNPRMGFEPQSPRGELLFISLRNVSLLSSRIAKKLFTPVPGGAGVAAPRTQCIRFSSATSRWSSFKALVFRLPSRC